MQTAPYRVIFYRATRRRDGLPQRLPVATINVDGAMPREAAVELAIAQFRNRPRGHGRSDVVAKAWTS